MESEWVCIPIIPGLAINQWYYCIDYYVLQMRWKSRQSNLLDGGKSLFGDIVQPTDSFVWIIHQSADGTWMTDSVESQVSW